MGENLHETYADRIWGWPLPATRRAFLGPALPEARLSACDSICLPVSRDRFSTFVCRDGRLHTMIRQYSTRESSEIADALLRSTIPAILTFDLCSTIPKRLGSRSRSTVGVAHSAKSRRRTLVWSQKHSALEVTDPDPCRIITTPIALRCWVNRKP